MCIHLQLSHITRCPAGDEQAGRCTVRVIAAQFDEHALTSEACLDRRAFRQNAAARDHQAGAPARRGHRDAAQALDRNLGYAQGRGAPHFEDQVAQKRRWLALGWALKSGIGRTKIEAQSARQNHHAVHARSSGCKRNRHLAQRTPAAQRQRRNRCRWRAEEIVGGSGAQVFHVKTVCRHLGRFPESMPRPTQSHDDAFRAHDRLCIKWGRPEDLHATRDQDAPTADCKAVHPHLTPDRPFQACSKPGHHASVPQSDADGHQDGDRQGCDPEKNKTAGCTRQGGTMVPQDRVPPLEKS